MNNLEKARNLCSTLRKLVQESPELFHDSIDDDIVNYTEEIKQQINLHSCTSKVYDNGALMLGRVKDVLKCIRNQVEAGLDMCFTNQYDLINELYHDYKPNDIVMIDYENPMGPTIYSWNDTDVVKEVTN